ncbi:SspB family protein [Rhodovibrionaceae bacterium A322]
MSDEGLQYNVLVENALRTVVRDALSHTAEHGLYGDHHFYITFQTDRDDVIIPDKLRQRYDTEMTIVVQHRFWDLEVDDTRFKITLTFNDVPETLEIPLNAITSFADPSERFGLQFGGSAEELDSEEERILEEAAADLLEGDSEENQRPAASNKESDPADAESGDEADGAKVVTLDAFRKK